MTPSRIVLLRHGEKPADSSDPNLSPAGQAYAQKLAKLIPQRFPNPAALFATADSAHSDRPEETLAPTAQALKLPLQALYADAQYAELAALLTSSSAYAGQLIVVC